MGPSRCSGSDGQLAQYSPRGQIRKLVEASEPQGTIWPRSPRTNLLKEDEVGIVDQVLHTGEGLGTNGGPLWGCEATKCAERRSPQLKPCTLNALLAIREMPPNDGR